MEIIKEFGAELLGVVASAVIGFVGLQLQKLAKATSLQASEAGRQADLTAIQGAVLRAEGVALSALSPDTEGEPVDEGGAISAADDYLRASVGDAAKRLGADLGSIAAAAVVGAIARKGGK